MITASHEEAIRNYFKVMRTEYGMQQHLELIFGQFSQMIDDPKEAESVMDVLSQFFNKYLSWEILEPKMIAMYAAEFTEQEILEITAFYESPLGQKVIYLGPEMSKRGAEISQDIITEHKAELEQIIENAMDKVL